MKQYRRRSVDPLLSSLLAELPAVMVVGPRAVGKTTTAARHAATTVRLDRAGEAIAFQADPDAALRGLTEPVLLDEWQTVPSVLGAVKRAVDAKHTPGRYILTGSVRADIDAATWPGTGRVVRVEMYPLTIAEQLGRSTKPLVDRIIADDDLTPGGDAPDLLGYIELALRGGFPEAALGLSERARHRWLTGFVDQLVTPDALGIDGGRDPERLRRFFEAYALNSAGLAEDKTLYEAAGVNRKTAEAYRRLLINLVVLDEVPAWMSNRLKRLVRSPKRYLVDASLLAATLGATTATVLRDGDLLGRVLDTFVTAQLRAELAVSEERPRLFHLRQEQGRREVDLVVELGGQRVIGIEIKASSAPNAGDARHLEWLRDQLGERFIRGVVLHTGPAAYRLGERLVALPICALWA